MAKNKKKKKIINRGEDVKAFVPKDRKKLGGKGK